MHSIRNCPATLRLDHACPLPFVGFWNSTGAHVFLHCGVRLAHALKRLPPHAGTPFTFPKLLKGILFVASHGSHPTSQSHIARAVQEMRVLVPTETSVTQHLECMGRVRPAYIAYTHPAPFRPDDCTNYFGAGCST